MVSAAGAGDPSRMENTTPRIALIPVAARTKTDRPVVRRYRLGRVVEDLGPALAGHTVAAARGSAGPATRRA
jgi:hypothetical protein